MSQNKAALITGSAKRIGKQTALTLHEQGFDVVVHCNKSAKEAQALVDELNTLRSNSATYLQADLNQHDQVKQLAEQALQAFGRLDVLVNNASTFYPTDVADVTEHIWDDLFASNLKAPFFLSQYLADELNQRQGVIINIADIHADRPLKGYPIYCTAKAGLVMLTKSLSRELAPNIRVNAVAPGPILWHDNDLTEQDKTQVLDEVLLKRLGSPTNIAEAILYLIQADYVTGHVLAVDGGRSIFGGDKA